VVGTESLGQTTHEYCERVVRDLPILGRAVRLSVLLRRIDFELWTGGRLKFSPLHHLATPPSVAFNSGVNPRVIDDSSSLKLIRVSLHLERKDLLSEIHYPLTMVQAIAVVWMHTGLRSNEIMRLA
jgi:hypothetical protein